MNFPFELPKAFYLVSLWWIYITILVFVAVLIFDFVFFWTNSETHISGNPYNFIGWDFILKSILSEWKYLLGFLIFGVILGYFWYKLTKINFRKPT